MWIDDDAGARESAAVDDARVVELVGEHDVVGTEEGLQDRDVCGEPAVEEPNAWRAKPVGDRGFELCVEAVIAGDEARRAGTSACFVESGGSRTCETAVTREREVIVRGEARDFDAVEDDARALRAVDDARRATRVPRS
jgi:hypothetical protein